MKRLSVLAATVAIAVAACGGSTTGDTTSASTQQQSTTTVAPTTTAAATTTTATTTTTKARTLADDIIERGVIRVGVSTGDFPPFTEFEAAVAQALIDATVGDVDIEWIGLKGADRFTAVANGDVDFVIRLTAVTPERKAEANFITPYLMDGLTVAGPAELGLGSVADLNGLRIAVPLESTTQAQLTELLGDGTNYELVDVPQGQSAASVVTAGDADVYASSWIASVNAALDGDISFVSLAFDIPIAAFTALDQPEWAAQLDEAMVQFIESNDWVRALNANRVAMRPPWDPADMIAAGQ